MPAEIRTDNSRASKYRLARAVLIQHFSCPTSQGEQSAAFSRVFPKFRSSQFREFLDSHPLHFFLGSNAHVEIEGQDTDRHSTPLEMLYLMVSAGYCVAFIEGAEFKSSKVYQSQCFILQSSLTTGLSAGIPFHDNTQGQHHTPGRPRRTD